MLGLSEGEELGFFWYKVRAGAVNRNTEYCGLVKLYICMQGFQLWDGMVLGNVSARSY